MYSSLAMLRGLIGNEILLQLCDDDLVGSFVVSPPNTAYNNVVQAIEQADNLVDSYLVGRYDLPLSSTPKVIADVSANFALCNLYYRRHEMTVPEGIESRRKLFVKWLEDVKKGEVNIPELYTAKTSMAKSSKTSDDRIFTDTVLNKY